MAVTTTYLEGTGDAVPATAFGKTAVKKFTIDTATTNVASGEVVKLMTIPSETAILAVWANVTTAEGGTLTIDVGDYTTSTDAAIDADGFLDGVNGNSVAISQSRTITLTEGTPNTIAPAYYAGKGYTAAGAYLGVLFNNAADAAVIDILVEMADLR